MNISYKEKDLQFNKRVENPILTRDFSKTL
jgi:hypothetical protein